MTSWKGENKVEFNVNNIIYSENQRTFNNLSLLYWEKNANKCGIEDIIKKVVREEVTVKKCDIVENI